MTGYNHEVPGLDLVVWKKQLSGEWKMQVEAFSSDLAAGPSLTSPEQLAYDGSHIWAASGVTPTVARIPAS